MEHKNHSVIHLQCSILILTVWVFDCLVKDAAMFKKEQHSS